MQDALQMAKNVLSVMQRQLRAFGLYDGDAYIGYITLSDYNGSTPEVHIELSEEYRHRGIGYQALRLVIDEVLQKANVDFLIYRAHHDNAASVAIAEKCGGILIKSDPSIDRIIHTYHICHPVF